MKTLQHLILSIFTIIISVSLSNAQCSINFCSGGATLTADAPIFNSNNGSISIDNIVIGNIGCNQAIYKTGLEIYIYQLMPDGSRIFQCNIFNPSPNNTIGNISINFGQASLCGNNFNIGSILADSSNGFVACDGARYEIEALIYVTDNSTFTIGSQTIYGQLASSEYSVLNLGTVDANITGSFPGNGQPLTTSIIEEYNTGNNNSVTVTCNTDVDLYIEGLSRLGNCSPYNDLSVGIPSELENEFTYSINGGSPIVILDSTNGASGGQLQGPDASLGGFCYSGIFSGSAPYVFPASNVPTACNGATVLLTLTTTDLFTNQTATAQFTIIYQPSNCANVLNVNSNNISSGLYAANQIVNSAGRVLNGRNVDMSAGDCINLNNNFEVKANANFHAFIGPCQ